MAEMFLYRTFQPYSFFTILIFFPHTFQSPLFHSSLTYLFLTFTLPSTISVTLFPHLSHFSHFSHLRIRTYSIVSSTIEIRDELALSILIFSLPI